MRLYGRRWAVQIGTLRTTDLDVEFKATRTLHGRGGTAEVTLYNLAAVHRRELAGQRRPFVRLEAGYADGMSVLFQGDARQVTVRPQGPDWVARVTAGDGEHALRTARVGRSFGPDTRLVEVLAALADALGVGAGNLPQALAGRGLDRVGDTFPEGVVLHGPAVEALDRLARSAGLEVSVQAGVLQLLPLGGALQRGAVLLTPDTGLLESPEIQKTRTVKAKALLIPDLVPGQKVRLRSATLDALYRIEQADYAGDTRGEAWDVDMTLRELAA